MRNFKWGFSTLGCPELSLAEAIKLADDFDFPHLELRTLEGSLDLPVPELLELPGKADYTGLVTLEYEKHWHPELPEIRVALTAVNRFWRN